MSRIKHQRSEIDLDREEFGHVRDIEYAYADAEFHTLKKDDKNHNQYTSRLFFTLRIPWDTSWDTSHEPATVNLQLVVSLITPDDKNNDWKLFQEAKGNTIRTMSTAE